MCAFKQCYWHLKLLGIQPSSRSFNQVVSLEWLQGVEYTKAHGAAAVAGEADVTRENIAALIARGAPLLACIELPDMEANRLLSDGSQAPPAIVASELARSAPISYSR